MCYTSVDIIPATSVIRSFGILNEKGLEGLAVKQDSVSVKAFTLGILSETHKLTNRNAITYKERTY